MKKYFIFATLYATIITIAFNLTHYLRNGMSFRSPEYIWYYGIAKGVIEPYGSSIGNIIHIPAKLDPTQYFLKGIYSIYPSIYSVQVFSSICFIAVGILAFFLGREVFRQNKYRDALGVIFSACLITLYPLIFIYTAVFTHDTLQMVFVLAVLLFGIRFINTKNYKLLLPLAVLFFLGVGINMSIVFTVPILTLYLLRNKVDFRVLLLLITIFSVVGSYLTMQRLDFGNQLDVVPILPEQIFKAFLIPLMISIAGIYKCIKDKNMFMLGTFIYLFVAMLFMSRNIRWFTIAVALLITYTLKDIKLTRKTLFIPSFVFLLIGSQTVLLFVNEDTIEESVMSGVYEKEIEYTKDMMEFLSSLYGDTDIYLFVDPDRQSLVSIYAGEHTHCVYDSKLWAMTEKEAYYYCFYNMVDAIFFYPKEYSVEFKVRGEELVSILPSSATYITNEELFTISKENRFLAKMYFTNIYEYDNKQIQQYLAQKNKDSTLTYFKRVTSRVFSTDKRYYSFMVFRLKTLQELYFEGVDFSFLDK